MSNNNDIFYDVKWNYNVIAKEKHCEKKGSYNTYDIRVSNCDYKEIKSNVALDEETAKQIAELCERNQVHPCHFDDILEDFITCFTDDYIFS